MPVVGVTGTNGKTTTAYLLASILDAAGLRAGMLGTVAYRLGGEEREASRTTPEAPDVQQLLREMLRARLPVGGDGGVVARAGAEARRRHALRRRRLHQPHARSPRLSRATWRPTSRPSAGCSRCCRPTRAGGDQPRRSARRALVEIAASRCHLTRSRAADVTPGRIEMTLDGLRFDIQTPRGTVGIRRSWSAGRTSTTSSPRRRRRSALDLPLDAIERGIANLPGVPGRFERGLGPTTTSPWSSITRTPTTRCATCSRRRGRSHRGG